MLAQRRIVRELFAIAPEGIDVMEWVDQRPDCRMQAASLYLLALHGLTCMTTTRGLTFEALIAEQGETGGRAGDRTAAGDVCATSARGRAGLHEPVTLGGRDVYHYQSSEQAPSRTRVEPI